MRLVNPSSSSHLHAAVDRFPDAHATTIGAALSFMCILTSIMNVPVRGDSPSSEIEKAATFQASATCPFAYSSSVRTSMYMRSGSAASIDDTSVGDFFCQLPVIKTISSFFSPSCIRSAAERENAARGACARSGVRHAWRELAPDAARRPGRRDAGANAAVSGRSPRRRPDVLETMFGKSCDDRSGGRDEDKCSICSRFRPSLGELWT
mmetsp:Transcript_53803/g.127887  ORF Transcript_53803/g.127887 Transcript_53803/m.127887 type:complete len:208 (-) Transcript_53803:36-659(-)